MCLFLKLLRLFLALPTLVREIRDTHTWYNDAGESTAVTDPKAILKRTKLHHICFSLQLVRQIRSFLFLSSPSSSSSTWFYRLFPSPVTHHVTPHLHHSATPKCQQSPLTDGQTHGWAMSVVALKFSAVNVNKKKCLKLLDNACLFTIQRSYCLLIGSSSIQTIAPPHNIYHKQGLIFDDHFHLHTFQNVEMVVNITNRQEWSMSSSIDQFVMRSCFCPWHRKKSFCRTICTASWHLLL